MSGLCGLLSFGLLGMALWLREPLLFVAAGALWLIAVILERHASIEELIK